MLYALVDGDTIIASADLQAGLALGDCTARSASWALQTHAADPVAEHIHAALATGPAGLTRTQLRDVFGRNLPSARIEAALTTPWAPPAKPAATAPPPPAD